MIDIVFNPKWFNGIDSIFEGISVIVCILIASYSLKLYKFNKNKNFKDFSIAFFQSPAHFSHIIHSQLSPSLLESYPQLAEKTAYSAV